MREIIFRGKRIDNGKWIEGSLLYDTENSLAYIAEHFEDKAAYLREVIPETVGQYAGLIDKNGKKIFEGDVVRYMNKETMVVVWNKESASFAIAYSAINFNYLATISSAHIYLEVIGNIHDNPELIKEV